MAIDAKTVKKLRDRTGAGMMDCKEALKETGGDLDDAKDYLRKEGKAQAADKESDKASEGIITSKLSPDKERGVLLEMNCETDFVAKNDNFREFSSEVAELILNNSKIETIEQLKEAKINDKTVETVTSNLVLQLGEKISPAKFHRMEEASFIDAYTHANDKIGVLVEIDGEEEAFENPLLEEFAHNIALHIAASNPISVSPDDLPDEKVEKEKEIYRTQAKEQDKPEEIIPKIVNGKLNKYFEDVCLLEQEYIREEDMTVKDYLKSTIEEIGASIEIKRFVRLEI